MGELPRPGEVFGRYRIVRTIGHGGMGTVFEARQEDLARAVALKVLSPQLSSQPEFRERFAREAQTLAALDSPHVIQVYEYGEQAGHLYIATQLIHGPDLQRRIADAGRLDPAEALDVVGQLASGLADAHAAGLLHRDVKPSNVLVRESRGELHVYLCDFGIARGENDENTLTAGVIGTVGYMAPERHSGVAASVSSDVYSLGCVLWAALSGQSPYGALSGVQLALAHMNEPVPQLSEESAVASAVNRILSRSMAKDPRDRYPSASEMRRDLLMALETTKREPSGHVAVEQPRGMPTELRAPSAFAHGAVVRPRRRSRGPLMAVAGVLAVALIAVGGYSMAGGQATGAGGNDTPVAAPTDVVSSSASDPASSTPSSVRGSVDKKHVHGEPSPRVTASSTASATPAPVTAQAAPTVTCWNGQRVSDRAVCGTPTGRTGMTSVFPSLGSDCPSMTSSVAGKAEVYECRYEDFLIRYSRWSSGVDRYGYFTDANGVQGVDWWIGREFAGRQWTSYEEGDGQPYQWSATYRYALFSVSVEGVTAAARARGIGMVQAALPSRVGLS